MSSNLLMFLMLPFLVNCANKQNNADLSYENSLCLDYESDSYMGGQSYDSDDYEYDGNGSTGEWKKRYYKNDYDEDIESAPFIELLLSPNNDYYDDNFLSIRVTIYDNAPVVTVIPICKDDCEIKVRNNDTNNEGLMVPDKVDDALYYIGDKAMQWIQILQGGYSISLKYRPYFFEPDNIKTIAYHVNYNTGVVNAIREYLNIDIEKLASQSSYNETNEGCYGWEYYEPLIEYDGSYGARPDFEAQEWAVTVYGNKLKDGGTIKVKVILGGDEEDLDEEMEEHDYTFKVKKLGNNRYSFTDAKTGSNNVSCNGAKFHFYIYK